MPATRAAAACPTSCAAIIHTYERVIAEFEKGHVFISKKYISKIFELLESDDQEAIERLLEEPCRRTFDFRQAQAPWGCWKSRSSRCRHHVIS